MQLRSKRRRRFSSECIIFLKLARVWKKVTSIFVLLLTMVPELEKKQARAVNVYIVNQNMSFQIWTAPACFAHTCFSYFQLVWGSGRKTVSWTATHEKNLIHFFKKPLLLRTSTCFLVTQSNPVRSHWPSKRKSCLYCGTTMLNIWSRCRM